METCRRSQRFVRIWDASCDGTLASKHGTAPVTAHALMLWVASSTARLFPISSASKYLVPSVATAPSDLPHGTFAEPLASRSQKSKERASAYSFTCDLARGLSTDEPT